MFEHWNWTVSFAKWRWGTLHGVIEQILHIWPTVQLALKSSHGQAWMQGLAETISSEALVQFERVDQNAEHSYSAMASLLCKAFCTPACEARLMVYKESSLDLLGG